MYDAQDIAALLREHARLIRPERVTGPNLTYRNAGPDDAEFILSLRLDPAKNAHLSQVPDDIERQRAWLADYADIYFIIEHQGRPVGTVRLYDQRGTSFSWGSWILSANAPKSAAVESTLMVYQVGIELGFSASHFDVRTANEKVWKYHERCGAVRVGETDDSFLYEMGKGEIIALLNRYYSRGSIAVEW
jgi:RimJ/RimL family protein N-acetyltransferase